MSFSQAPVRQCSLKTHSPAVLPIQECASETRATKRRRGLILPREHRAWGLLLVPVVTGAGVAFHYASQIFPLTRLLTAALALFWLRTPLESLLGTSAMRRAKAGRIAYAPLGCLFVGRNCRRGAGRFALGGQKCGSVAAGCGSGRSVHPGEIVGGRIIEPETSSTLSTSVMFAVPPSCER